MAALTLLAALPLAPAPAEAGSKLRVGVGRADITPPTGYYSMGYVRGDGLIEGAYGRLWARVVVLERGGQKVALVSQDLGGIPGGMLQHAIERVSGLGYSERNVLDSASHTHGGPAGIFNFDTYNTVFMTINSPTDFQLAGGFDPQLYAFMVERLATAIRRADRDLGPGRAGWGATELSGVTVNRSIEAHLRNHGIEKEFGEGSVSDDPEGELHTVSTPVDVLRVEKRLGGEWTPVGMWSTYANHGTVNKYQFRYYNADHHAGATELTERRVRRRGGVPRGQEVVTAYGNADEGDMSAGLEHDGPAEAAEVGRREGRAMMRAWRQAAGSLTRKPALDTRWTRMCFCGQLTEAGRVSDRGVFGLGQFTGSDEARGPLFDVTRVPFEGRHLPVSSGPQGNKIQVAEGEVPAAVPLVVMRVGDRVIGSMPGETSKEMGVRVRETLLEATRGSGVRRAVLSGLANEFTSYFVTPEEYGAQHYEGAATLYGQASSVAVAEELGRLARRLADGRPNPEPYAYDPTNGVEDDAPPFPRGAAEGTLLGQPIERPRRLGDVAVRWRGGERGFDRPLDRAFVRAQLRREGGGWQTVDDDLGLNVLWYVDDDGNYLARWQPPIDAPAGTYRIVIRANRYRLLSRELRLRPSRALIAERVPAPAGRAAIELHYPGPVSHQEIDDPPPDDQADLAYRPHKARKGRVRFLVDGEVAIARAGRDGRFEIDAPPGSRVEVRAGAARDQHGNRNRERLVFDA